MDPETPATDGDDGLRERVATLLQKFASPAAVGPAEAAFLLDRLHAPPGARMLCCPRSMIAYGWALAAGGCSVHLASGQEPGAFDGAVWSIEAWVGASTDRFLASSLKGGARLVLIAEPAGGPAPALSSSFSRLWEAISPDGRRLNVWVRRGP